MGLTKFDPADHIASIEDAMEYLRCAAEGNDKAHFLSALADVQRALASNDSGQD